MRIALLVAKFETGGLMAVNSQLVSSLTQKGHQVVLVSATNNTGTSSQIPKDSISLEANSSFRSISFVKSKLFRGDYDIVIASQLFIGLIALWARPRKSLTSLLLVEHSSLDYWKDSPKVKDRLVLFFSKVLLGKVDQIAAVSRETTKSINDEFRKLRRPAVYLPNPVLNGKELIFEVEQNPVTARSGIVFAGRLSAEKRVPDIIQAFALVANEVNDNLLILGDGPEMHRCIDLVNELKISDRVTFTGFVDNVQDFLRKSRCLVLASSHEGLAVILVEALANGCQVVSTDCPTGPREILENGKYGQLVEVGDIKGISKAIKLAIQKTISTDGLDGHLRQFLTENSAECYERLCTEIISGRRKLYQK